MSDKETTTIQVKSNDQVSEEEIVVEDNAAKFLREREGQYDDITPEEEAKIVKKVDWILIPWLTVLATMGAVDKQSLGTAAIYGFRDDNNLTTSQYSWLGSILFIGSLAGMWPVSYLFQVLRLGKLLATMSLLWSAMTLLLCACKGFKGLMVLRFLMGVAECAIVPGCTLMVGRFYLKKEQGVRLAVVFAFLSSVINGFLSWLAGNFGNAISKWKYIYIMVGSISFTWGIVMFFFLPDTPMNAKFLSDREKYIITRRVMTNNTGMETNKWKWYQAREALTDVKMYIIFFFNIGINILNGGLSVFTAIIINNLGFDAKESSLMSIPTGVIATIATISFNFLCKKFPNRRCLIGIILLIFPIIGAILLYSINKVGGSVGPQLLGLYLLYFYFAPYVIFISLSQANTAGNTKKSCVYSFNYLGYAAGAVAGGKSYDSGFDGGFVAMIVALAFCMSMFGTYWVVVKAQNRHRARDLETTQTIEALDLTDKEQKTFVYTN